MNSLQDTIADIPNQLNKVLGIENEKELIKNPSSVVVCGMGGSGIVGNLLHAILPTINITFHKNYGLPKALEENVLLLIVSYSGNTRETLSAYQEARTKNLPLAVISGGGRLMSQAKNDTVAHVTVPWQKDIPARFMVASLLRAALEIFEKIELIDSVKKQVAVFEDEVRTDWSGEVNSLVPELVGKTILIYTSPELEGLANIWKDGLNETAKTPAFVNVIPEMTHNEIESLEFLGERFIILLKDPQEDKQVWQHVEVFEKILLEKNWAHTVITLDHEERILDLLDSAIFALSVALALAETKNIDPIATPLIDETKRRLKNK